MGVGAARSSTPCNYNVRVEPGGRVLCCMGLVPSKENMQQRARGAERKSTLCIHRFMFSRSMPITALLSGRVALCKGLVREENMPQKAQGRKAAAFCAMADCTASCSSGEASRLFLASELRCARA